MKFEDPRAQAVFDGYLARHAEELDRMRALGPKVFDVRDEFLLPVGEESAWFLHSLVMARRPKRILELGTSYGYSTLFLADAASKVGGTVITMELEGYKQDYAKARLAEAGLDSVVDWRCGDAVALIEEDDGPFDFILLDIWKELYQPSFDAFYPKLSEEAVICSDNMIDPASARPSVRIYREAVRSKPDLQTALLPVGQGIEISVKWSAGNAKL